MKYDYHKAYKELNEMFFNYEIDGQDWSVQDMLLFYDWVQQ